MEKINEKLKVIIILLWIIALLLLIQISQANSTEISIGYGKDIPVRRLQSDSLVCSAMELEISEKFKSLWYSSVVLDRMRGKVNPGVIDGDYFSGTYNGLAISGRVGMQKRLFGSMHYSLFGGLGMLIGIMPEIGNSKVVGHFGAGVKYVMANWEFGYKWSHMSDPLRHGDHGWNTQLITVGRRF